MRLVSIAGKPYAVINGKDYAVYRWFEHGRAGPLFIQVAGRTSLSKDDLPTADWILTGGRDGKHRIATAWRAPWFERKLGATRKLAFLGASTAGSLFLALRYVAKRFGIVAETAELVARATALATPDGSEPPCRHLVRERDQGLTTSALVVLDIPSYFDTKDASALLGR